MELSHESDSALDNWEGEFMANSLVTLVAAIHLAAMIAEIFFWPLVAKRVAGFDGALIVKTRALGFNQGLYNGFLSAGLFLTFGVQDIAIRTDAQTFFLACVVAAGVVGYISFKKLSLLLGQAGIAVIAIWAVLGTQ